MPTSIVSTLAKRAAPFRARTFDKPLQQKFWPHVYNELPGSGKNVDRLQVITGTNTKPLAVQITGSILSTKHEQDGDLHISFHPDSSGFPINHDIAAAVPLEVEIIYAGRVSQPDAVGAQKKFVNPFDISKLKKGTRVQIAGPLIFDRVHGTFDAAGNVEEGLEIHPVDALKIVA